MSYLLPEAGETKTYDLAAMTSAYARLSETRHCQAPGGGKRSVVDVSCSEVVN